MTPVSEAAQSCPTLCNPMDCSLPHSSVHGIFHARVLEWVAISCSRGSSWPRDWTQVSRIVGRHFTIWATRKVTLYSSPSLTQAKLFFFSFFKQNSCFHLDFAQCLYCWHSTWSVWSVHVFPTVLSTASPPLPLVLVKLRGLAVPFSWAG